ncbi:unnamed protein product, partial [Acanthoscelides obtectus]
FVRCEIRTKIIFVYFFSVDKRGFITLRRKNWRERTLKTGVVEIFGQESHYNRSKPRRIYLSAELNIKKFWNLYNTQVKDNLQQVNYKYFSRVFNNKFNLLELHLQYADSV